MKVLADEDCAHVMKMNGAFRFGEVNWGLIMHKFAACLALTATLGWTVAASAATVNVNNGTVSINGGKPVSRSAQVKVGDTVTAGPNGSATIVYADNCTMRVGAGTSVSVTNDDHCALGLAGVGGTGLQFGAALVASTVGIGIAISQKDGHKKSASP